MRILGRLAFRDSTLTFCTAIGIVALSVPAAASGPHAPNYTYTIVHDFTGAPNDGRGPIAEVTLDSASNIYGTTSGGGANDEGLLFEFTSAGNEKLLHSFGGGSDGTSPDGGVIIDANGNMYGTTNYGGAFNNGTVLILMGPRYPTHGTRVGPTGNGRKRVR